MNIPGALVIGNKSIYYASLDDWKADLKKQAAAFAAQSASSEETTASKVTTTTTAAVGISQSTANTASNAVAALLPKGDAPVTNASIALQTLRKFQDQMDAMKLAAAALAAKTGTIGGPNNSDSEAAAATASKATAAPPAGHLNQIA